MGSRVPRLAAPTAAESRLMPKTQLDARGMMELAVDIMRQSVSETRPDGKATPLVGALLWTPAGDVITAYRGELRDGDHAEFTLLERKCRDRKLDGCILLSTLEPCAPGARRHPKLGCAERIVLARIKEVWIGIEDPDPTVDRKGIKYLQDNGVKVHMFDREVQERIREVNRVFISQATVRAAAANKEKRTKEVTLSPLEKAFDQSLSEDLATDALAAYRKVAGIEEPIDSPAFRRRLAAKGLLKRDGNNWTPTGFGLLLFGKEPRKHMQQAGLLGTIHFADGREELRDFVGPQVLVPAQALEWLRDKLPDPIDRTEARRQSAGKALLELAREGIVNALVHRSYDITGAKCQLIVKPETIVVKSPGGPQPPITLEQMQSFTAPMLSRNPILHFVFSRMELAEERGLGLKSMKQRAQKAGLPLPVYTWEDPYLVLTIYRTAASVVRTLEPDVLARLNQDEQAAYRFLTTTVAATSAELRGALECDERKAQRLLKKLLDLDLISREGKGRATYYRLLPRG